MLASSSESAALTGRQSASRNGGVGGKQQNAPPAQSLIQNQGSRCAIGFQPGWEKPDGFAATFFRHQSLQRST